MTLLCAHIATKENVIYYANIPEYTT